MIEYNTAIVLIGASLLGANAGMIGTYAMLRGRALMGDALAHAALPGLCLAFLFVGERSLPAMLTGAMISGVLGVGVVAALHRYTKIKEDAAIGIVLSVFFGAGVAMSGWIQKQTTGGSKAGLDTFILGKTAGMVRADLYLMAGVAAASLIVVVVLYKEFKLVVFDSGFARVQGFPALALDFLLMVLIAATVVIGLPAVGVVLMAAMLILPAAAARFWTDRLSMLLVLSGIIGTITGGVGTLISASRTGMPAGAVIVLTGSCLFVASLLFGVRRGAIARFAERRRLSRRLAEQLALRGFLRVAQGAAGLRRAEFADLARETSQRGRLQGVLARLVSKGELRLLDGAAYQLEPAGEARAQRIEQGYRRVEEFLTQQPDLASAVTVLDVEALTLPTADDDPFGLAREAEATEHSVGGRPSREPA